MNREIDSSRGTRERLPAKGRCIEKSTVLPADRTARGTDPGKLYSIGVGRGNPGLLCEWQAVIEEEEPHYENREKNSRAA